MIPYYFKECQKMSINSFLPIKIPWYKIRWFFKSMYCFFRGHTLIDAKWINKENPEEYEIHRGCWYCPKHEIISKEDYIKKDFEPKIKDY